MQLVHTCKPCYLGLILTVYLKMKMNVDEIAVLKLFVFIVCCLFACCLFLLFVVCCLFACCLFLLFVFIVCLGSRGSVLV